MSNHLSGHFGTLDYYRRLGWTGLEEFTAENAKNAEEEKNIGTQTRHTDGGQMNADLLD